MAADNDKKPESPRKAASRDFSTLPATERRQIVRAVNRGDPVTVRRHAPFAIAVARRQIRFWKYAWLLGPVLGAIQLTITDEPSVALANGAFGTVILGAFSFFWIRRARRSIEANLPIAQRKIGPPGTSSGALPSRKAASHMPKGRAPRGKKRRSR